jgi:VanZ family protein
MPLRIVMLGLALACAFVAIYGSFVPLDVRAVPIGEATRQFVDMPFVPLSRASGSDLVTNVLLFVPIGFFGLGAAAGLSRQSAIVLLVPVVFATTTLSVAIEFGQIFVHGRTPSWNDVVSQIAGSSIGVALWVAVGARAIDWVVAVSGGKRSDAHDRLLPLLGAFTCLWAIVGLMPFDFTVRLEELAQKARAGGIVLRPFSDATSLRNSGAMLLLAIPVGAFFVGVARSVGASRPFAAGLVAGVASAVAIEAAQLFSFSRPSDVTDVIVATAGMSVGARVMARSSGLAERAPSARVARVRLWPMVALLGWTTLLLSRHWSPFDFVIDGSFARQRVPMLMRVPFYGYYHGFAPAVLVDVVIKLAMAVPIGALLQMAWRPAQPAVRRAVALAIVAVSGALFLAIELGQLLLPSRYPDQTDVYVGAAGAALGVWLVLRFDRRSRPPV